jgi:hypothetical protein
MMVPTIVAAPTREPPILCQRVHADGFVIDPDGSAFMVALKVLPACT